MRSHLRRIFAVRRDRGRPPGHGVAICRNVLASLMATSLEAIGIPVLVELCGVYYLVAAMCCMLVATTVSFLLNKYWVFEAHHGHAPKQYGRQLLLAAGSFGSNTSLIWAFTEHVGLHYYLSFVCAAVLVFFCWNYPGSRWFVFSDGHRRPPAPAPAAVAVTAFD